jgi:hypothetical protein
VGEADILSRELPNTFLWALVGVFGALHFVMSMIPLFVLTGGGGFISLGVVSAVAIGYLLGPVYGTVSAVIGSLLGVAVFNIGGIVGPLVPILSTSSSAFVAGSLRNGQPRHAVILYLLGFLLFALSPIGALALPYLWLHAVALVVLLGILLPKLRFWFRQNLAVHTDRPEKGLLPLLILTFIAIMADHLIGGAVAAYWFVLILGWGVQPTALAYVGLMFAYPLERLAVTLVATAVIMALSRALDKSDISLPGNRNAPDVES